MKKYMLFLSLFLLGYGAFAQQGMSKPDLKSEEAAIRDISKHWLDLDRSRDFNAITDLFADDAVLYRTNQDPIKGADAIRKYFTEQGQKNPKEVSDWSTDHVDISGSGDLAVEYGNYSSKNGGSTGNESVKGNFVTVYKKDNGKWKIIADVTNTTSPTSPM
ncbi:MAG TPA: SgcJ/EcaC family oxidoreductase [Bacteroidales bacterium]|jgi:uncharacterized protein (TIGR02246 family)|nr:SgcJ/EcaC family oxidoreductase [Bacteroidales bacterium]